MNDTVSTKKTSAKSSPAKTETAKSTPAESAPAKTDTAAATSGGGTSDSTTSSAPKEKVTSGKAAMGGAGEVHYGFFSNVKTPHYRSRWDSIWSKGRKSDGKAAKKSEKGVAAKKSPARRSIRPKDPLEVSLTLDDLPDEVRAALIEAARAKLKGSRVSYDRRDKAGAVSWNIACTVRR